jgi:pilus assembly protein FimV
VARQGCLGKKKEVDCLTMMGLLQGMKGDHQAAVDAFKQALGNEQADAEAQKALHFEIGSSWEAMGNGGKALFHFQKVAKSEAKYRDVSTIVERLSATAKVEDDSAAPKAVGLKGGAKGSTVNAPDAKTRKVGYV